MRILDIKPNISEKMKIMPISNDELNSIKPMCPKDTLKSGDIVIVRNDFNYYVFLTFEDLKKYKIDKKIFSQTQNIDYRQDLLEKIKEGIFVSAHINGIDMRTVCFGWMGLSSYDDNLEMKNGHSDYDVTFAYRPNTLLDLENTESYHKSYLNKEINSQKGRILFGKTKNIKQNIFEKMKVIPISNNELDQITEYKNKRPIDLLKSGDIVKLGDGSLFKFLSSEDFKKYGIDKKLLSQQHSQTVISEIEKGKGIFLYYTLLGQFRYFSLDLYDENLKAKNRNLLFDVEAIHRCEDLEHDFSKPSSYYRNSLSAEYNDSETIVVFDRKQEISEKMNENRNIDELPDGIYDAYFYAYVFELVDGTKYKTNTGVRRSKRMTSLKKYKVENGQIDEL